MKKILLCLVVIALLLTGCGNTREEEDIAKQIEALSKQMEELKSSNEKMTAELQEVQATLDEAENLTPVPTETPVPTDTPTPTYTPTPTNTSTPTPTKTPRPTATPKPTNIPKPTRTPTPKPVKKTGITNTGEIINVNGSDLINCVGVEPLAKGVTNDELNIDLISKKGISGSRFNLKAVIKIPKNEGLTGNFKLEINPGYSYRDNILIYLNKGEITKCDERYEEINGVYCIYYDRDFNFGESSNYNFVRIKLHGTTDVDKACFYFGEMVLSTGTDKLYLNVNDTDVSVSAVVYITKEKYPVNIIRGTIWAIDMPVEIFVGQEIDFNVHSMDGDENIICSSSNEEVASINERVIKAHKRGTVVITGVNGNTGDKVECGLKVIEPYINVVNEVNDAFIGQKIDFSAKSFGDKNVDLSWSVSDKSVANINKTTGEFKALSEGSTTVTVKNGLSGVSKSFTVNVKDFSDSDFSKYVSFNFNGLVSSDLENKVRKLIRDIYENVFQFYNDGKPAYVTINIKPSGFFANVGSGVPAYTTWENSKAVIYMNERHINNNPKDLDCLTHELIHCAQQYQGLTNDLVWLMEGLTDYGRGMFGLYNEEAGWRYQPFTLGTKYTDSYTVTAGFLDYLTRKFNKEIVWLLHKDLKDQSYNDSVWIEYTGYSVDGLWMMYEDEAMSKVKELGVGDILPDFTLPILRNGNYDQTVSLSDYRGKVVIVDFWGLWCGPCLDELPYIQKVQDRLDDLVILGLCNDTPQDATNYMNERGFTFNVIYDKEYGFGRGQCGVKRWPTTFLLDKNGRVVKEETVDSSNLNDYINYIERLMEQ